VHAIVSAGDGLINVASKPGVGSLFEVFLPRCMDKDLPPGVNARHTAARVRATT